MKYKAFYIRGALLALFFLIKPSESYAYIDPGTGSYFLQMFIGIFIGAVFAVKIYWARIKSFLGNIFQKGEIDGRKKSS
jgi:hypothetical protein